MSEYVITVISVYALFWFAFFWHAVERAKVWSSEKFKGNPCGRFLYVLLSLCTLAALACIWPVLIAKWLVEQWLDLA